MPEFSNIQTYEKIDGENYQPTLYRFIRVLKRIGIWNDENIQAFKDFKWNVEDDGMVYGALMGMKPTNTRFSDIPVRPHVMVYSSQLLVDSKEHWISCDLLIETEKLYRTATGYSAEAISLVTELTIEMTKEFSQTGVYFTDEAQDGQDLDGIRTNNKSHLWQFDYAIIPKALSEIYSSPPDGYHVKEQDNHLEVSRTMYFKANK